MPGSPKFRLGVLLVHGMGTPASGETLVRWGDALVNTISRASKHTVIATLERATPGGGGSSPKHAEAVLLLQHEGSTERWLLSEGRWAESFPPPNYRELVSWSVRALPWSVVTHIAQGYWRATSVDGKFTRYVASAVAIIKLLITLLFTPLFLAILALMLVVGLIPKLRPLILSVQSTLTASVGDSLAFIESPVRAALIKTRILDGLERLKRLSEYTVVIAHSQGAAAVVAALGGIVEPHLDKAVTKDCPTATRPVPDRLITFGAGVNQLVAQKVLSGGLPKQFQVNPSTIIIGALIAIVVLSYWLYSELKEHASPLWDVSRMLGYYSLLIIGLSVVTLATIPLMDWLGKRWQILERNREKITLVVLMLLLFGALIPFMRYVDNTGLPFGPLNFLMLALVTLAGSTSMVLSRELQSILAVVQKPPGLKSWHDLYASADPVPNGPTRTNQSGVPQTQQIWNIGSTFGDHTAYLKNLDGFVLRTVRLCAEAAKSPWLGALPVETSAIDERAAWRVGFLRLSRWSVGVAWVFLGGLIWQKYDARIPIPFEPPSWFPNAALGGARLMTLFVLVAIALWASSQVLQWLWFRWVRAEQYIVLAHDQPEGLAGSVSFALFAMGFIVWTVCWAALEMLVELRTDDLERLQAAIFSLPVLATGSSFMSTFLLLIFNKPPVDKDASTTKASETPITS